MRYIKWLSLLLFLLVTSCLDMFRDQEINIVDVIYYVNIDGRGDPFIGRKISRGNYEILIQGNLVQAEGTKRSLLVKMAPGSGSNPVDTSYYKINMSGKRPTIDTLYDDQYYKILNSLSIDVKFNPY